jgi:hypothetical protein
LFFPFFALTQNGAEKGKNNGPINSNLCYFDIIQTTVTKHSPKVYRYPFSKTNYCLLAIAGITQKPIVYLTGIRIFAMPCPCSLD